LLSHAKIRVREITAYSYCVVLQFLIFVARERQWIFYSNLSLFLSLTILLALVLFCSSSYGYAYDLAFQRNQSNEIYNAIRTFNIPSEISSIGVQEAMPEFAFYDNISGLLLQGSSTFWKDSRGMCLQEFTCTLNYSHEFQGSLEVGTNVTTNHTYSWITGGEFKVVPQERYLLTTYLKVNKYSLQSHILLEGFNESSEKWVQLNQCPPGTNGPKEWQMFRCLVTLPNNITEARPVLNAGWSLTGKNMAVTSFGNIYLNHVDNSAVLLDNSLSTQVVYDGLHRPSAMAFLNRDDFLILDKDSGKVERIVKGSKLEHPLLDLNVTSNDGLIGIAIDKRSFSNPTVYLYYSATEVNDCNSCEAIGNRLVKYDLVDNMTKLAHPKLLLDLPSSKSSSPMHNGGPVIIGPDNNVYLSVGDLHSIPEAGTGNASYNKAINYSNGTDADGRAGILRITKEGLSVSDHGILGDSGILSKYFAYGIRNSFGMSFDPLSGKLWITDNGPDLGDEINLVEPGFNGGWAFMAGSNHMSNNSYYSEWKHPTATFDFNGRGHYREPEFEWRNPVGPTALTFVHTAGLGEKYANTLFLGDWLGNLYYFRLNENRSSLLLEGDLRDKVANTTGEADLRKIGEGFGIITDLKVGPDDSLYVVSLIPGKVYKIHLKE
jgi:glucose/arabinose dehydrogenase